MILIVLLCLYLTNLSVSFLYTEFISPLFGYSAFRTKDPLDLVIKYTFANIIYLFRFKKLLHHRQQIEKCEVLFRIIIPLVLQILFTCIIYFIYIVSDNLANNSTNLLFGIFVLIKLVLLIYSYKLIK